MYRRFLTFALLLALAPLALAQTTATPLIPRVQLNTSHGEIVLQLDGRRAPLTVRNFLNYVEAGHYDGTVFHRVISGFMIQGGGFDADLTEKPGGGPIPNESGNGLSNARGTIAMARTGNPHSATAQFFINVVNNTRLDPSPRRWGYAVFGQVVEGMDVVDTIAALETGPGGRFGGDVPTTTVIIEKAFVVEPAAKPKKMK